MINNKTKKIVCLCLMGLISAGVGVGTYYGTKKLLATNGNSASSSVVCGAPDYSRCYIGFLPTHSGADSSLHVSLNTSKGGMFSKTYDISNSLAHVVGLPSSYYWVDFGGYISSLKNDSGTDATNLKNWSIYLKDTSDCVSVPFDFLNLWGAYAVGFGSLEASGNKKAFPLVYDYETIPFCACDSSTNGSEK